MSEVRLPSCLEGEEDPVHGHPTAHDVTSERLTASSALYDEEAGSFPSLEDARSVWRALDLALDTWDLWEVQALAGFLRRLAPALLIQCQTECTPETVHDAVSVASEWQRLCRRTNSDCYPALTTHAYALMQCFAVLKDVDALRQASVCFNEAVGCDSSLVREDSFLVLCAYWTCTAYLARATNSLSDWEANLDIGRRVVAAGPTQLGDRHRLMTNIGVSYVMAEELKGDSQHLAQAVVLFRNAVGIVPNGDSSAYAMHHLGDALSRLGHEQHNLASLAEAEELHRRVLLELEKQEEPPIVGLPLDDMHISTVLHLGVALDSLGTVLIRQYQRTGISGQLEEAIDVQEAAVNFIAGIGEVDLLAAATMNNLANALHLKYQTHNDVNSLDEAVRYKQTFPMIFLFLTPDQDSRPNACNVRTGSSSLRH
jgi:tetratricopeptide (TPR) repeat protein